MSHINEDVHTRLDSDFFLSWNDTDMIILCWHIKAHVASLNLGWLIGKSHFDHRLTAVRTTWKVHSSLVDYLAQVINAKNCPTTFLLHFSIGMGSYDHHAKYQGVFP